MVATKSMGGASRTGAENEGATPYPNVVDSWLVASISYLLWLDYLASSALHLIIHSTICGRYYKVVVKQVSYLDVGRSPPLALSHQHLGVGHGCDSLPDQTIREKSLEKNLKLDYWARQVATHLRMFDECQTGLKMLLRTGRSSSKSQQIATEEVFELGKVAEFVSGPQLTLLQLISASKSRRHSQSITPLRVSAK